MFWEAINKKINFDVEFEKLDSIINFKNVKENLIIKLWDLWNFKTKLITNIYSIYCIINSWDQKL